MRIAFMISLGVLLLAATRVCAGPLIILDHAQGSYDAQSAQLIQQPWASERPSTRLVERPLAGLIATKLGFAEGKAELFSYQLENAPPDGAKLNGFVDGAGIKLKLSW